MTIPMRALSLVAGLAAPFVLLGCNPITVTATATFANGDQSESDSLTLAYDAAGPGGRLAMRRGSAVHYLQDIGLSVSPPNVSEETLYLQVFTRPAPYVSENDDPGRVRTGDSGLLDAHSPALTGLVVESGSETSGSATARLSEGRDLGAAYLARVEDTDAVLRWIISEPDCIPAGPGDCFDMQTITARMLAAVDAGFNAAFAADSRIRRNGATTLYAYVPSFVPAVDAPGRRVRGFTLIFRIPTQVRVRRNVGPVGPPYHAADVYVPVAILLESQNNPPGVLVTLDPVDRAGGIVPSEMLPSLVVDVEYSAPLDRPFAEAIASELLAGIQSRLSNPATFTPGASDLLTRGFDVLLGNRNLGEDFELVLLPDTAAPLDGSVISTQVLPADGLPGLQLVFLE